eukprot:TRINITY_DN11966_c3_g8_i1.p1 TRINITY_DN11966_c3_g8~~TRINITY_DN11966_c3_g8_i1.p1  ORF type:complete len:1108 (+),score=201.38 TRINITY_DN11966_c3_g8_i1:109-3432(+)
MSSWYFGIMASLNQVSALLKLLIDPQESFQRFQAEEHALDASDHVTNGNDQPQLLDYPNATEEEGKVLSESLANQSTTSAVVADPTVRSVLGEKPSLPSVPTVATSHPPQSIQLQKRSMRPSQSSPLSDANSLNIDVNGLASKAPLLRSLERPSTRPTSTGMSHLTHYSEDSLVSFEPEWPSRAPSAAPMDTLQSGGASPQGDTTSIITTAIVTSGRKDPSSHKADSMHAPVTPQDSPPANPALAQTQSQPADNLSGRPMISLFSHAEPVELNHHAEHNADDIVPGNRPAKQAKYMVHDKIMISHSTPMSSSDLTSQADKSVPLPLPPVQQQQQQQQQLHRPDPDCTLAKASSDEELRGPSRDSPGILNQHMDVVSSCIADKNSFNAEGHDHPQYTDGQNESMSEHRRLVQLNLSSSDDESVNEQLSRRSSSCQNTCEAVKVADADSVDADNSDLGQACSRSDASKLLLELASAPSQAFVKQLDAVNAIQNGSPTDRNSHAAVGDIDQGTTCRGQEAVDDTAVSKVGDTGKVPEQPSTLFVSDRTNNDIASSGFQGVAATEHVLASTLNEDQQGEGVEDSSDHQERELLKGSVEVTSVDEDVSSRYDSADNEDVEIASTHGPISESELPMLTNHTIEAAHVSQTDGVASSHSDEPSQPCVDDADKDAAELTISDDRNALERPMTRRRRSRSSAAPSQPTPSHPQSYPDMLDTSDTFTPSSVETSSPILTTPQLPNGNALHSDTTLANKPSLRTTTPTSTTTTTTVTTTTTNSMSESVDLHSQPSRRQLAAPRRKRTKAGGSKPVRNIVLDELRLLLYQAKLTTEQRRSLTGRCVTLRKVNANLEQCIERDRSVVAVYERMMKKAPGYGRRLVERPREAMSETSSMADPHSRPGSAMGTEIESVRSGHGKSKLRRQEGVSKRAKRAPQPRKVGDVVVKTDEYGSEAPVRWIVPRWQPIATTAVAEKATAVATPHWRRLDDTTLQSSQSASKRVEVMTDERYLKRHAPLELAERRVKLRDAAALEGILRRAQAPDDDDDNSDKDDSGDEETSPWVPGPLAVKLPTSRFQRKQAGKLRLSIQDQVPRTAFGRPVPVLQPKKFMLPSGLKS